MADWLIRARNEIPTIARSHTANSANRLLMAVTAVSVLTERDSAKSSNGSIGSAEAQGQETRLLKTERRHRTGAEIPQSAENCTAFTANRPLLAVTAVPIPASSECSVVSNGSNGSVERDADGGRSSNQLTANPLSARERAVLLDWLEGIREDDLAIVQHLLNTCEADLSARSFFLSCAAEAGHRGQTDSNTNRNLQTKNELQTGKSIEETDHDDR